MGPYKYTFRRKFKTYLKFVNRTIPSPKLVLDAACSYGKFIHLFENDYYMGIDINENAIIHLRENYPSRHKFFKINLISDVYPKNFKFLEENSQTDGEFDLVISTHTLSHIHKKKQFHVIDKLLDSTKINGFIILHINSVNDESIRYLKEKVVVVNESKYRGAISDYMENHFSDTFHMSRIGKLINRMLSFFDLGSRDTILLCKRA